jgi:hypothetical protein
MCKSGRATGKEKKTPLVISGAVVKEDAAFTPEAVKSFHDKPIPSHDEFARRKCDKRGPELFQPRK